MKRDSCNANSRASEVPRLSPESPSPAMRPTTLYPDIQIMAPSRAPFVCKRCSRALRLQSEANTSRSFATVTRERRKSPPSNAPPSSEQLPRWKQTPPAMKMPVRLRPLPKQPDWKVNEKEEPLDEMYDRFLGSVGRSRDQGESIQGRDMLPEEIKVCRTYSCTMMSP